MKKINTNLLRLGELSTGLYALAPQPAVRLDISKISETNLEIVKTKELMDKLSNIVETNKLNNFKYNSITDVEREYAQLKLINPLTAEEKVLENARHKVAFHLQELVVKNKSFNNYMGFDITDSEILTAKKLIYKSRYKLDYDLLVKTEVDKYIFFVLIEFLDTYPIMINILYRFPTLEAKVNMALKFLDEKLKNSEEKPKNNKPNSQIKPVVKEKVVSKYDVNKDTNVVGLVTNGNHLVTRKGVVLAKYTEGYSLETKWGSNAGSYSNTVGNPWIAGSFWGTGGTETINVSLKNKSEEIYLTWNDIETMCVLMGMMKMKSD